MTDFLHTAGYIVLTWIALSLPLAVVWSRFMSRMDRKELTLTTPRRRQSARRTHPVPQLAHTRL